MVDNLRLKKDEAVSLILRGVYEGFGYRKYRTNKIEEYGLYADNKNFLKSEQIITFNGLDGRLMALKPDVTLSIAKNINVGEGQTEKLYYTENVFRAAKHSKEFKEIGQMGLEAMGVVDDYTTLEVVNLALQSLNTIDGNFVLDISHIGFVGGLMESIDCDILAKNSLVECIVGKNVYDMRKIAKEINLPSEIIDTLEKIITLNGSFDEELSVAKSLVANEIMDNAVKELSILREALRGNEWKGKIRLDFSIVNDTNYYNGLVLRGYVSKVPTPVLSGGRYDLLTQKFGKDICAIGFALYLDELSRCYPDQNDNEADVLLVYKPADDMSAVLKRIKDLNKKGLKVRASLTVPNNFFYKTKEIFDNGGK